MILKKIQRKFYKLFHPVVGEVWMLHRVVERRSEKPEQRDLEVTPEWLEQKILDYQKQGYDFVAIDDLKPRGKWVCITFDDGYRDNYTLACPLLKRLGVPFVVYVTTGFVDNQLPIWWYPGEKLGIGTEDLKQLDAEPLCTIGAHTVSHPELDVLTCEQQYKEIVESKQTLEGLLGHEVRHFSFPHGAHNDDTLKICKELGFNTMVQSWGGGIRKGLKPCPLPRINMEER